MKVTTGYAFALIAGGNAFAAQLVRRQATRDTEVRVILSDQSTETGSQVSFPLVTSRVYDTPTGANTLFETIEVSVGSQAQQDL